MTDVQFDDLQGPALVVFRGLPASGKTTRAKREVLASGSRRVRVVRTSRDDLRRSMHIKPDYESEQEELVTVAQRAMLDALLQSGVIVIVDDTNLMDRYVAALQRIADSNNAYFYVVDEFLRVPLSECLSRDTMRNPVERVGKEVILSMWQRFQVQQEGQKS